MTVSIVFTDLVFISDVLLADGADAVTLRLTFTVHNEVLLSNLNWTTGAIADPAIPETMDASEFLARAQSALIASA